MVKNIHQYFVYIMTKHKKGILYTGITNDLFRRVFEHKVGQHEGFTKRYGLKKLVYYEAYQFVMDAIKREKRIKHWRRQWKLIYLKRKILIGLTWQWIGTPNCQKNRTCHSRKNGSL